MIEKGFTKPTDRIIRLQNQILNARPYVEFKRAVLATEAYKASEGLPAIVRRAKVAEKIFNELPATVRDDELIVGAITKNLRSIEICPEFSFDWVEKEFDTMATRMADPFEIPKETAAELHEAFKYWPGKTTSDLAASYMSKKTHDCINDGVFTVGSYYFGRVGHVCVDYGKILKIGFRGIIARAVKELELLDRMDPSYIKKQQFYNAIIITYNAAINFAHRYADKAEELAQSCSCPIRKQELQQITQNCRRVPENGATNFWEACQTMWFIQCMMMQIESSGHSISPGRSDQYMCPYLEADKSINREFVQKLVDCIWIKLNDVNKTRDEISAQAFAGYAVFQNLCVGGQTEDGLDATNYVSYMCMETVAHVQLPAPSFSIRVWQDTPDEFLYRVAEVVRLGLGVPAIYNDEVIIPALQNRGVSLADARDYGIVGGVEPQAIHRTEGWHDAAFFNVAKVLEITLHSGKVGDLQLGPVTNCMTTWKSLDDFYEAFSTQMAFFVKHLAEADNCVDIAHAERVPLPFQSAMVDDCLGRGMSVQEGNAIYNFTCPQAFGYRRQRRQLLRDEEVRLRREDALHGRSEGNPGRQLRPGRRRQGSGDRRKRADRRVGLRGRSQGARQLLPPTCRPSKTRSIARWRQATAATSTKASAGCSTAPPASATTSTKAISSPASTLRSTARKSRSTRTRAAASSRPASTRFRQTCSSARMLRLFPTAVPPRHPGRRRVAPGEGTDRGRQLRGQARPLHRLQRNALQPEVPPLGSRR